MNYYPICLRVAGRSCLVVGGGKIAEQKIQSLLNAGARVTVISPELTPGLHSRAATKEITHHRRHYRDGDVRGFFLAYAATNDDAVHEQIAAEAAIAGVLLNVVDRPHRGNFIMPSILERGDLTIAISTGGASPALAARIRRDLEAVFGPEYAVALTILRRLRERLAGGTQDTDRQHVFRTLVDSPLLEYLRRGQHDALDALLAAIVGGDVSLASLGIERSVKE